MSAAKPGWYPDPAADRDARPARYRWWDGTQWSDATGASARAADPELATSAAADPSVAAVSSAGEQHPAASGIRPELTSPRSLDMLAVGTGRTGARRRGAGLPALHAASRWTLAIAFVTAVAVVVGLVVWRDPDISGADAGRARSPDPAEHASSGRPVGRLDEVTREVVLGSASMTLPDDPYEIYGEPMRISGLVDEFFQANAVVHPRYDWNRDWSAVVGLAQVNSSHTDSGELDQAATSALRQFAQVFFGGKPTTVRRLRTADHAVDGRPGVRLTAEVHYKLPGLHSRFDRVTAVLVRQDDGSVIAAFSSIPNDCPPEFSTLARESLSSLQIG